MQRANSSEPIVDFVYGSTQLTGDGKKGGKQHSSTALLRAFLSCFYEKRIRNQIAMGRLPSFLSLIHFIPRK
jgi:hypothetical protein